MRQIAVLFFILFSFSLRAENPPDIHLQIEGDPSCFCQQDPLAKHLPSSAKAKHSLENLDAQPDLVIGGHVHVLSGHFLDHQVDIRLPGGEELTLERTYSSQHRQTGRLATGWDYNHFHHVLRYLDAIALYEGNQWIHFYRENPFQPRNYSIRKQSFLKGGVTNCGAGGMGAYSLIKNLKLTKEQKAYVLNSKGVKKRIFNTKVKGVKQHFLSKDLFLSGNTISYEYIQNQMGISATLLDRNAHPVAGLDFSWDYKDLQGIRYIRGSFKKNVTYHFKKPKEHLNFLLTKVESSEAPTIHYSYKSYNRSENYVLTKKNLPEERGISAKYYWDGKHNTQGYNIKYCRISPHYLSVKALLAPVGKDATRLPIYQFVYIPCDPKSSFSQKTLVFDAYDNLSVYQFDPNRRLKRLLRCKKNVLFSKEEYSWDEEGKLLSRALFDANQNLQFKRTFAYDASGNVIKETLFGNLTGEGKQHDCKEFFYNSKDLMIYSKEGRKETYTVYHPQTNLIAAQYITVDDKPYKRTFYEYDANGLVSFECTDDGIYLEQSELSGVTLRKLIYTRTERALPVEITEKAYDLTTSEEKLIKRCVNTFCSKGRLIQEEIFDSDNQLFSVKEWHYDSFGNVIQEVNPLNQHTIKAYDANNNLIFEQGETTWHKEFLYDFSNRLIQETIVEASGKQITQETHYDYLGHPVKVLDRFRNSTESTFDPFGRITSVLQPEALSPIKMEVDVMGRPTRLIHPLGHQTEMAYTLRNAPYYKKSPDGSEEHWRYDLEGNTLTYLDQEGTLTCATYDGLGRMTSKEVSFQGEVLRKETFGYNSFHLLWKKDPQGVETRYSYDFAGRLIQESTEDLVTTYTYDSMGRISSTQTADIINRFVYDKLHRKIQETTEDLFGNKIKDITCTYNFSGQKTLIQEGDGVTLIEYNSEGNVTKMIDPDGAITATCYKEIQNEKGHFVLLKEITNPLGITTKIEHDRAGRAVKKKTVDLMGNLLVSIECLYDEGNNLIEERVNKEQITCFSYDSMGRLQKATQGFGKFEEKSTYYSYNKKGELLLTVKPDGVSLDSTYDPLGRLIEEKSSDGTVHHTFSYDLCDRILSATNEITKTTVQRTLDALGRMTQEKLASGLILGYTYDSASRLTQTVLPDGSAVNYTYQGPLIKTITKDNFKSSFNAYTFECIQSMKLAQVEITFSYTPSKQIASIHSPYWKTDQLCYDGNKNLLSQTIQDFRGERTYHYTYDSLNQIQEEEGHHYRYDTFYNRIEKDGQLTSYNALNQPENLTFDPNGNLLDFHDFTLSYDAFNRLTEAKSQDKTITFSYDPFGRMVERTCNGNKATFLYQGECEIGALDASSNLTSLRILNPLFPSERGASVALFIEGTLYIPIHDASSNLIQLLNEEGTVAENYLYTAFGEEESQGTLSPWRFSCKRVDPDTGLLFFGKRFYDPTSGRWITQDPIGRQAGHNFYAFVHNNPLTHYDLFGLLDQPQSVLQRALERVVSFVKSMVRLPGRVLEHVSRNFVPLPIAKDAFACIGHFLAGRSFKNYTPSWKNSSHLVYIQGELESGGVYITGNGIITKKEEALQRAKKLSQDLGGMSVALIYNNSNGFILDVIDCFLQSKGIVTNSCAVAIRSLQQIAKDNPGKELWISVHSHFARILRLSSKYLSPEIRDRMVVNTFGGAALIEEGIFKDTTNHVSDRDWVPRIADPLNYVKARFNPNTNVKFYRSKTGEFNDHSWDGATYQEALSNVNKKFKDQFFGAKS